MFRRAFAKTSNSSKLPTSNHLQAIGSRARGRSAYDAAAQPCRWNILSRSKDVDKRAIIREVRLLVTGGTGSNSEDAGL